MMTFEKPGHENTAACVALALERAKAMNAPIVAASYTGHTAFALLDAMEEQGLNIPLVVVRGTFGFHEPGAFRMTQEAEDAITARGGRIVSAAHALSGAERALSRKFQGVYPVEIVAHTLRMFGQGTKVCVECATMALDAGVLPYGQPVVAVAGTGKGADTCVVLTPAHSHEILQTKIHQTLCKPFL
jgi:hypothetical protein